VWAGEEGAVYVIDQGRSNEAMDPHLTRHLQLHEATQARGAGYTNNKSLDKAGSGIDQDAIHKNCIGYEVQVSSELVW
jgi:hypothetical protein